MEGKLGVSQLVAVLKKRGIKNIIISPGSRNAPLILGFTADPFFSCYSIVDERSAGFIAIGMGLKESEPAALVCTSGSALLNYYPAVAEAYYQNVPLIVISADRPSYFIGQGLGQTINQKGVFEPHIRYEAEIIEQPSTESEIRKNDRKINEAINRSLQFNQGPVHLNVPMKEPLYGKLPKYVNPGLIKISETHTELSDSSLHEFGKVWRNSKRIMIIAGQQNSDSALWKILENVAKYAVILTETTSNQHFRGVFDNIDRLLMPMSTRELKLFQPDLLITFGGMIISKKIKKYLREYSPQQHWHISKQTTAPDPYYSLTDIIPIKPFWFFRQLHLHTGDQERSWKNEIQKIDEKRSKKHLEFMNSCPWSDMQVFEVLSSKVLPGTQIHLANSSPIRYAQLFDWKSGISFHANRGTSGIDGCVSTALGSAMVSRETVWLVTGDLAFFYDANALWNRHIPSNLKIIVINNQGGGIFRIIEGPSGTDVLEDYFETRQSNSVEKVAQSSGIPYHIATSKEELESAVVSMISRHNETEILEIITPKEENDEMLKKYFNFLKNS
jgi:2-succinyl-5-enolpyruvyl-6-hydroxy-3-cyclohexene-1-carboxylate synthase